MAENYLKHVVDLTNMGGPTIFVAASDAPDNDKERAAYVCTGVDDHLTIQEAIAALPADGGMVQLSTGTFNGHVRIKKAKVALVGSGWSTIIKIQAGAVLKDSDCPVRVLADDCYVGNLTVDGNKSAQTHLGDWEADAGLVREFDGVAMYANRCMVDNVRAQQCLGHHIILWSDPFELEDIAGGARYGCVAQNCHVMDLGGRNALDFASTWDLGAGYDQNINYGNVIRGCVLHNGANIVVHTGHDTLVEGNVVMGGGGIAFHTNSRRVAIRNNVVIGATSSGIAMNGGLAEQASAAVRRSWDCVVEGNTIYGGTSNGISCLRLSDSIVRNNVIINAGNRGILFEQCEGLDIESNQIRGATEQSIYQSGDTEELRSHDIVIRDNFIRGTDTKHSISLTRSTRAFIKGNIIYDGDRGISVQSSTVSLTVEGNTIQNASNQCIVLSGHTGSVVKNNTFIGIAGSTVAQIQGNDMQVIGNSFSGGSVGITTTAAATGNVITDNVINVSSTSPIWTAPTAGEIRRNTQYLTEARGTATVASGGTSIDVTHALKRTPTAQNISVTPTNNLGNATKFWVSDVGASTFRINVDADPGAVTATFAWQTSF